MLSKGNVICTEGPGFVNVSLSRLIGNFRLLLSLGVTR